MKAFVVAIIVALMASTASAGDNTIAHFKGNCLKTGGMLQFVDKHWVCATTEKTALNASQTSIPRLYPGFKQ
jgi:hypothetical protein